MVFTDEDNDDDPAYQFSVSRHRQSPANRKPTRQKPRSTASERFTDVEELDAYDDAVRPRKRQKQVDRDPIRLKWSDEDSDIPLELETQRPTTKHRRQVTEHKSRANGTSKRTTNRPQASSTTGVGKYGPRKKKRRSKIPSFDEDSSGGSEKDDTIPDYVRDRRKKFNERTQRLKEAGLMLPPSYDEIYFSDDDRLRHLKEKPDFLRLKPLAPYKDIELPYSLGVIPASIARYLRDYQVKGAAFMHELFVYQKGGILGDDMGLGKTIQVIAFLTAAYGKTGDERDRKRLRKMRRTRKWYPRTLIICPGSLMSNWRDELNRWGWWNADIFHGPAEHKQSVLDSAKAGMLEIMITTYVTYRLNKSAINTIAWDCVITDECHQIKERKSEVTKAMNEVNSMCRIGLTGTAIQNRYEELWTLLNWASPGTFGAISEWKKSICIPLKLGQSHNATAYELATARKTAKKLVENLLPHFFLRRMKTLIKDQLPKKTDRIVFCPLTPDQASAYVNFLNGEAITTIKTSSELCDCPGERKRSGKKKGWCCYALLENGDKWQSWTFPCIAYLQRLCNHLALLVPSGTDIKDKQDKDLDLLQVAVPGRWKEMYKNRDNIINYSNTDWCGKWRVLRKLLKFWYDQGNNKILVFSHSVKLLRMLQALFVHTSYNIKYLDGSMSYDERYEAVAEFNSDPSQFVFLISTRAGGVGLNITSANKVVIVDPNWNPSYDLQAQDRAYRIGQTRDVEVFRLISQGTMEEIVYARQIYKQQQASIGYNASTERRYFQGVQDRQDQKGEIFGLQNLFAYQDENIVLRDIMHKTNVAESKADVRVTSFEIEEEHPESDSDVENEDKVKQEDDVNPYSQSNGRDWANAAMSQLAAEITGELDVTKSKKSRKSKSSTKGALPTSFTSTDPETNRLRRDPIQAILSSAGVSYTHDNSEVIGTSRVEAELSKRAELATGTQQQTRVFKTDSQSQSQSAIAPTSNGTHEHVAIPDEFNYKYRPSEDVKRRIFCSMAQWAGYCHGDRESKDGSGDVQGVIDFALVVESWTPAERRECLERWYEWRREQIINGHLEDGGEEKEVRKMELANSMAEHAIKSESKQDFKSFLIKQESKKPMEPVVISDDDDEL